MEGFGDRVTVLRKQRGWTRRALAAKAGLHEKHLSKVEAGERKRIEADTVIALALTLGVSADFLLGIGEPPCLDRSALK